MKKQAPLEQIGTTSPVEYPRTGADLEAELSADLNNPTPEEVNLGTLAATEKFDMSTLSLDHRPKLQRVESADSAAEGASDEAFRRLMNQK